ncbi:hypothetical protein Hanom_Chr11g01009611 [Helianthus anomalus]
MALFVCAILRGTFAHRCLGRLQEMELDAHRTIDTGFLDHHWIDRSGQVREFMPATSAWSHLFEAFHGRSHREFTLEFFCTFAVYIRKM